MLTCVDVKFIFERVHLGFSSSANILQIANVALRVVFLLFLHVFSFISPSSSCSYSWNEKKCPPFLFHNQTTQPRPQVFSVTVP